MIRSPSVVRDWDAFFSGDPAFTQPPKSEGEPTDADKEAAESYIAALKAARETGDWKPLLVDGQTPTKFVMRQVDRNIWRAIMDRAVLPGDSPRHIGQVSLNALLFRLSIKEVVGWDKFDRQSDPNWDFWTMAPASLVTQLDEIDPRIVGEIGSLVFERLRGVRPLS
jgi:hypothetical protein